MFKSKKTSSRGGGGGNLYARTIRNIRHDPSITGKSVGLAYFVAMHILPIFTVTPRWTTVGRPSSHLVMVFDQMILTLDIFGQ